MKKVLATIMTAVLTVGVLAGCGSNSAETKNLSGINVNKYVKSLDEYKGMELTATRTEITDEYVTSYIDYMLENSKEAVAVTGRAVQSGDVVNIDYVGTKDGVAFDGGTAQGYDLTIGSGTFIDGFEDGLIGVNIGETVDLDLSFPESYPVADLAGQAVVFSVTVNSISEQVKPELTDEYVKGLGIDDCENVEEFRVVVENSLKETDEINVQNELQTQASEQLMMIADFSDDVPEELYNYYRDQIYSNFENYATSAGMEVMDFVSQYYGMTEEEFEAEVDSGATISARQAMVCALIAEKEGIEVTDEELQAEVEKNYANFGYESADAYMESGNAEDYRDYLLTSKVLDFLVENAVVTETTAEDTTSATE